MTRQAPFSQKNITCQDWKQFMAEQAKGSVDLILTDPPYAISRQTGFSSYKNGEPRFAVSMDFGKWDHEPIDLPAFAKACYRVLRTGGTAIIWYDLWKITELEKALSVAGFKMLRLIIWQKTNPVPLNQSASYLSNSREIAVVAVKGGKPTFHGLYDNGIYNYPIPRHGGTGKKIHPTQKPFELFSDLVLGHSNKGDLIIDPFMGSGTTGVAAIENNRHFKGCDIDKKYFMLACKRLKAISVNKSLPELFLELAEPDEEGFSKRVDVEDFIGPYEGLRFGNGGSWCRDDGTLAKKFNIRRIKKGNRIVAVELHGYKKIPIDKPVPIGIKRTISNKRCAVLATSKVEVSHKDGRWDDPRLFDIKTVREDDFQPLSKAANNAKRQHCKKCRETNKRFDARQLGYHKGYVRGDKIYSGTCVGCYWYNPYAFNQLISKKPRKSKE